MSIKSIFQHAYPYLSVAASLVPGAGPALDIAAKVLSTTTGTSVKSEPNAIAETLSKLATSEEGRLQLAASEQEYNKAMTQLGFDQIEKMQELLVQDRDSARKMQIETRAKLPSVLAVLAVVLLATCIFLLAFVSLKEGAKDAIILLIGFVGAAYKDVYGFVFGSSADAASKSETINKIAQS
jgi:lipopolysaccharide export LptBFGC system permease protein LptF